MPMPRAREFALPILPRHRRGRRLVQLYVGLVIYGLSMAFQLRANLGLDPWDVFHQGLVIHSNLSFGTVVILTGAVVLLLWWPLRQRPGLGTISNVIVVGLAVDFFLAVIPTMTNLVAQIVMLVAGVVAGAFATACYIGAGLGPGPRDGLMTGLVARTGGSIRVVRTAIEIGVLVIGWLLGGTFGVGTVVYALAIGPLVHILLPRMAIGAPEPTPTPAPARG